MLCISENHILLYYQSYYLSSGRYLSVYDKFSSLLNSSANQDIDLFLKDKHSLEVFTQVCFLTQVDYNLEEQNII